MIDIVDIVNSYAKLFGNKTKKEILLAEKRYSICLECPEKSSLGICKVCKSYKEKCNVLAILFFYIYMKVEKSALK